MQNPSHLRLHQFAGFQPGPRLIVTAAVHGNETCGVGAVQAVIAALDSGALTLLKGSVTFIPIVNALAHAKGQREGDRNLNRNLRPPVVPQDHEDRIARQLCPQLAAHDVLLDLHSFLGRGQPFVMLGPLDNDGELEPFAHAAQEAALAACLGPTHVVEGWLSTYELGLKRRAAKASDTGTGSRKQALVQDPNYGVGTTEYMRSQGGYCVTLECGQHTSPDAPEVARLAILRTLRLLGMIAPDAVAAHAPMSPPDVLQLYEVIDREDMGDTFAQEWTSFDALEAGQRIGTRADGTPVLAPSAGRIVFPNTKSQPGTEWFYLARPSTRQL